MKMTKYQQGLGLIEIMIGIIVVSGIVYIVTTGGGTVFGGSNANNYVSMVTTVDNEVKSMLRTGPDTTAATTANLIAGDRLETMLNSAGTGYEYPAFGSVVTVAPADIAPGTNNAWDVTFTNVPKATCADATSMLHTKFREIRINGVVAKDATTTPSTADLIAACNLDNNTVAHRNSPGAV